MLKKNDVEINEAVCKILAFEYNSQKEYDLVKETRIEVFWPIVYTNTLLVMGIVCVIICILAIFGFIVFFPIMLIILLIVIIGGIIYWMVSNCKCTNNTSTSV